MKNFIKNVLVTTALCIVVITIAGAFLGAEYFKFSGIFQILCVNTVIYFLLQFTSEVSFYHWSIQIGLELFLLNIVILISRYLFHWSDFFSIPLTMFITILVYVLARFFDSSYLKQSTDDINRQINNRKDGD